MKEEKKINSSANVIEQINSFSNFTIFFEKLFRGELILTGIEKVKLARELSKLNALLNQNNISDIEKRKIIIRKEIIRLAISNNIESKKSIVISLTDIHHYIISLKLREKISSIDPYFFEHIVAELLRHLSYSDVETTKKSRDGGVDIIAYSTIGNSERIKTVVQVKRTKSNIGRPVVDNLRGAMSSHDADRGLVITTSNFTKDCRKSVEQKNALKVSLISGDELIELLIKHNIGVNKENFTVSSIDEVFFGSI